MTILVVSIAVLAVLTTTLIVAAALHKVVWRVRQPRRAAVERGARRRVVELIAGGTISADEIRAMPKAELRALERMIAAFRPKLRGEARETLEELIEMRNVEAQARRRARWPGAVGRLRAAHTLGLVASPSAVDALIGLLHDRDADVRSTAAASLGRIGDPRAAGPLVCSVGAKRVVPAGIAVDAVVKTGAGAIPALLDALASESREVRRAAIDALGFLHASEAVPVLRLMLLVEGDERSRARTAAALGRIGSPRAVDALVRALDVARTPALRVAVLEALEALAPEEARPAIERCLDLDDHAVVRTAAAAMLALGDPGRMALEARIADGEAGAEHAAERIAEMQLALHGAPLQRLWP